MQLLVLTSAVVALVLVGLSIRHFRLRRRTLAHPAPVAPSTTPQLSAVRLLRSEEEIDAAIKVAAEMEQRLLTIAERRYAHYRTPLATGPTMLRQPALDQIA